MAVLHNLWKEIIRRCSVHESIYVCLYSKKYIIIIIITIIIMRYANW